MSRRGHLLAAILVAAASVLPACGDSCREYSAYSCAQLEKATYNAYFYYPGNTREEYLGTANGLSHCGSMAHAFASSKNLSRSDGWNYVCCLKTATSNCAEKHR